MISCRNVHIQRFLDDIAALKQKRTATEKDGDEEEEEEALELQAPPAGKGANAGVEAPDGDEKPVSKLKRSASCKSKKSVSFTPSEIQEQVDPELATGYKTSEHGERKRSRHVLRKQESFETGEEREGHAGGDTGVDSSESRFDYQRGTTLKGKKPFSRAGPLGKRHGVSRFKAAAMRVMKEAEHKKSATKSDAGNAANSVNETKKELIDLREIVVAEAVVPVRTATYPTSKETAPIATPDSLSPATSLEGRTDSSLDILEAIRPVPPGSPVKGGEFFGDSNGPLAPEKIPALEREHERTTRSDRIRMWHRVYAQQNVVSVQMTPNSDPCLSDSSTSQCLFIDSDLQRETNV